MNRKSRKSHAFVWQIRKDRMKQFSVAERYSFSFYYLPINQAKGMIGGGCPACRRVMSGIIRFVVLVVCFNNGFDQPVAYHITRIELHRSDSRHISENMQGFAQAGFLAVR